MENKEHKKLHRSTNRKVTVTVKKTEIPEEHNSKDVTDSDSNVDILDIQKTVFEKNELVEYLKSIIGLEVAIRNNNKELKAFKDIQEKAIVFNPPTKPEYNPPVRNVVKANTNKKVSFDGDIFPIIAWGVAGAGSIFLFGPFMMILILYLFGYTLDDEFPNMIASVIWILIEIVFIVVYTYKASRKIRLMKQENQRIVQSETKKNNEEYQEQCKKSKEEFDEKMKMYQNAYDRYQQEYERVVKSRQQSRRKKLQQFNDESQRLSVELANLYSKNILHEKYRNLEAVTSIYDYISTGRCQTLGGRDGAYNLYEEHLIKEKSEEEIQRLENIVANLQKDLQSERELNCLRMQHDSFRRSMDNFELKMALQDSIHDLSMNIDSCL